MKLIGKKRRDLSIPRGVLVAGIGVAHHAGRRVVPQDALHPLARLRRASQTMTMPACREKANGRQPSPPGTSTRELSRELTPRFSRFTICESYYGRESMRLTLWAFLVLVIPCHSAGAQTPFNPRDFTAMPQPSQIPAPSITAQQLSAECLRYFKDAKYNGSIAGDKRFWPGTINVKFSTMGEVTHNARLNRPTCRVHYYWANKFTSSQDNIFIHFDGRWAIGHNLIMETRGTSLLFTAYREGGLRSWATYERE